MRKHLSFAGALLAPLAAVACILTGGYAPPGDTPPPPPSDTHPVSGKPTGLPPPPHDRQFTELRRSSVKEAERLYELPPLEEPVIVTTLNGGEHWHYKGKGANAYPRDNFGDGWMGVVQVGDRREYWLICRMGSSPVGGVFFKKQWDGDPTQGWTTELEDPTKALPYFSNSPSQINIDTYTFAQNPRTKLVTIPHFAKPGYMWPNVPPMSGDSEPGYLQRAQTMAGGKEPSNFTRFKDEVLMQPDTTSPYEQLYQRGNTYQGSSCETSLVIAPPYAILLWEHKTWGPADWTGQIFKGRLHRAWCWLWELDRNPKFRRIAGEGYVFDPEEARLPERSTNNGDALWGTANVTLRPGVTINPNDNIMHMVYLTGRPQVRSDGTPANGKVNDSMGIAHLWSDDYAWKWHWDAGTLRGGRAPLMMERGLPGYRDNGTSNRINSPFILFDVGAKSPEFPNGTGWVMFWGNPEDTMGQPGTRLWAMRFKL